LIRDKVKFPFSLSHGNEYMDQSCGTFVDIPSGAKVVLPEVQVQLSAIILADAPLSVL
jgi:hypothetical protein